MIIKIKGDVFVNSGLGNISELGQPYSVTVTCATPGATITITATGMATVTSTSGTATMSNIPYATRAYYTVSAEGYTTKTGSTASGGTIPVTLTAVNTGGGNTGGDTPTQPTTYTFTINPTPSDATVTLTASGYSQSGNSITVPSGTSVAWKVSKTGYTEQTGTHTVTGNLNKNVVLIEVSGKTLTCIVNKNINGSNEIVMAPGRCYFEEYIATNGKTPKASFNNTDIKPTIAYRYYDSDKNFIGWGTSDASTSTYARVCLLFQENTLVDPLMLHGEVLIINDVYYTIDCLIQHNDIKVKYQLNKNIGADGVISENGGIGRIAFEKYFETNGSALNVSHNIENISTVALRYYKDIDVVNDLYSSPSGSSYGRIVMVVADGTALNDELVEGKTLIVNNNVCIISNS